MEDSKIIELYWQRDEDAIHMIKKGYFDFSENQDIRSLVDLCDNLLYDEYEDHTNFASCVVYNLSSLKHYYSFSYVLHCDKFDNSLKMYFIQRNEKYAYIFGMFAMNLLQVYLMLKMHFMY